MKLIRKATVLAVLSSIFCIAPASADIIVTWEDNGGDLVIRWNGDISNWTHQHQGNINFNVLQTNNGMHAINGPYDLSWTGTAHNWYLGPYLSSNVGVHVGDTFGSSGLSNWIYMPQNYSGQEITGSLTYAGQGGLLGNFVEGARDLGFGENDNIIFRAADVPEPGAIALIGLGLLGLVARRKVKV